MHKFKEHAVWDVRDSVLDQVCSDIDGTWIYDPGN